MDGNLSIPQPRKPMPVDRKTLDYTASSSALDRTANYLMEMLKFMPDYERKSYNATVEDADFTQYGELTADGELTFGQVLANTRAIGGAYGVDGLQFLADNAADFQHLDGELIANNAATNSLISGALWTKALNALQNESRSYYELMMEGIDDLSPEQSFYVLTAMLESRTRVADTLSGIFGAAGQSDTQRLAVFESWYTANLEDADPIKAAFVQFFLNASQSFTAHILPLYGGSDAQYVDQADKTNALAFMTALTEKITTYISSLAGSAKTEAQAIWNAWLNPANMPAAEQNVDPSATVWGKQVIEKLQAEMNKIIHGNIANRVAYRARYEKYKKDKEEYEEKVEEAEKEELRQEKAAKQKQAEQKELEEKIAAQNRENNKAKTGEVKTVKAVEFKPREQQAKQTKASTNNKPTPKVAAKAPAPKPVKATTAAAPVKVNSSSKNNNSALANKPVTRVRVGSVNQTSRLATKKVLAVQSVKTKSGRSRRVRPRSKKVWGKPAAIKL
ncbi:MAG: hypothetical protein LBD99_01255 [Candidatus Margulisbacteria bacterium]|nr:hypothetical protein [Candidatus Margulisiibacteriota bacterium]